MGNIHKSKKELKSSVVELHKFDRDDACVNILHSTTYGDNICQIWQNSVFFTSLYKNHILYGCQGNKYGQKNLYIGSGGAPGSLDAGRHRAMQPGLRCREMRSTTLQRAGVEGILVYQGICLVPDVMMCMCTSDNSRHCVRCVGDVRRGSFLILYNMVRAMSARLCSRLRHLT